MEIKSVNPIIKATLSEEEITKYTRIGEEVIKNGQVAVCTMAGGQGSRLGFDGPKGCFELTFSDGTKKSIFEIQIEKLKKCLEKHKIALKWFIMTSSDNDKATKEFFEKKDYFGYPREKVIFFKQGELALTREDGTVVLDENSNVVMAANGNGGIFKALEDEDILKDMKANGILYIVTCNVDNILVDPLDEVVIGILKENDTELGIKSIARTNPTEKVGSIVLKDGNTSVIEYVDMPKELIEAYNDDGSLMFAESHFGCNYINIRLLERIADQKLPLHDAHKTSEKYGNYIKHEMFIFDGFEKARSCSVIRVKREDEFAPIKNKEGTDSPATAVALFEAQM